MGGGQRVRQRVKGPRIHVRLRAEDLAGGAGTSQEEQGLGRGYRDSPGRSTGDKGWS